MKRGLFALLLAGCSAGPSAKPPPDLGGVTEQFAPTKVPVGQALGAAAILSLDDAQGRAADLDRLSGLGAGLVRRDFLWSVLEPARGQFDFAAEDQAVDETGARGIATVGILAYDAPWATASGDEHAPPDPDLYAAFAEATAAHFRGRVAAWEIWNEENLGYRFWVPSEDPYAYGLLLARAYAAVKRGDPDATVVLGGLNSEGLTSSAEDFLASAYFFHPDLGKSYDAIAIHPYPNYPPVNPPEETNGTDYALGLKLARLRAMLEYYGDGQKPIWVTEYGWPVYAAVDEAAQARYLVRGAIEAMAAGADRVCFYTLDDGPNPTAFPPEDAFGVVRNDGTPKPAYAALAKLLGDDPTAMLVSDDGSGAMRSYGFAGAHKRFHVSFTTDPGSDPVYTDDP